METLEYTPAQASAEPLVDALDHFASLLARELASFGTHAERSQTTGLHLALLDTSY